MQFCMLVLICIKIHLKCILGFEPNLRNYYILPDNNCSCSSSAGVPMDCCLKCKTKFIASSSRSKATLVCCTTFGTVLMCCQCYPAGQHFCRTGSLAESSRKHILDSKWLSFHRKVYDFHETCFIFNTCLLTGAPRGTKVFFFFFYLLSSAKVLARTVLEE